MPDIGNTSTPPDYWINDKYRWERFYTEIESIWYCIGPNDCLADHDHKVKHLKFMLHQYPWLIMDVFRSPLNCGNFSAWVFTVIVDTAAYMVAKERNVELNLTTLDLEPYKRPEHKQTC